MSILTKFSQFLAGIKTYSGVEIHGKHVSFFIDIRKYELPSYDDKTLSLIRQQMSEKPTHPFTLVMKFYFKNKKSKFFKSLIELIKKNLIEVMEEEARFILHDFYTIHIKFDYENDDNVLGYELSVFSDDDAFFVFYFKAIPFLLTEEPEYFKTSIFHELIHSLRLKKTVQERSMKIRTQKILERKIKKGSHFEGGTGDKLNLTLLQRYNPIILQTSFLSLLKEGIARFAEELKRSGEIKFTTDFNLFIKYLYEICDARLPRDKLDKLWKELMRLTYILGPMIVAVIVFFRLFKNDRKFSVWIKQEGLITSKEFNADQIKHFYGNQEFTLQFQLEEVNIMIDETIEYLSKISHIEFFKVYEEACAYFKINPFITLKLYSELKRRSWEGYITKNKT